LRDLHARLPTGPDAVSFGLGMPSAELFPNAAYGRAVAQLLASDPKALQYALPSPVLKRHIVALMSLRGVTCSPDQVFLTAGGQQGISLLSRLFLDPGRVVVADEVTYEGFSAAIQPVRPRVLTVPVDADVGSDPDALQSLLRRGARPAFVYLIPDGHNPLGCSMPLDARRKFVALAREFQVLMVEDGAYGLLQYDEKPAPPLRALDDEWVCYVGSFSKILAPAIRVGWLVVPTWMIPLLSRTKQGEDLDVGNLNQCALATYLDAEDFPRHLERLRSEYRVRRDRMLAALKAHFPVGTRWNHPSCGFYIWCELPPGLDATERVDAAIAAAVSFVPGDVFRLGGRQLRGSMRLSFSTYAPNRIEEGIRRLGWVLHAVTDPGSPGHVGHVVVGGDW